MYIDYFDEYQQRASRTMAGSPDTKESYEVKAVRQSIWAMGLVGESIEVMEYFVSGHGEVTVLKKELGDVCWYIAAMCQEHNLQMSDVAGFPMVLGYTNKVETIAKPRTDATFLVLKAGRLSEYMKKVVGHGHKFDREKLQGHLSDVLMQVSCLCNGCGLILPEVFGRNIEKLEARYKDGFSTEASESRYIKP